LSQEIRAGFPCPHLLIEEPVEISSDRQSLPTKAPVSNGGSVRILVNNSIYVPPEGLLSQASLCAAKSGPYQILKCQGTTGPDGNLFKITTKSGSVEIRLPTGDRISLADIQRALRATSAFDLVSIGDKDGALLLTDLNTAGRESFLRVSGEGALALGFTQNGARGALVYPGWSLVARPDLFPGVRPPGFALVPAKYPKFDSPVTGNPNFKVTYAAMPERCPRCGGTYVENDWRFDFQGDVVQIENEDLLYQACLKAILTVQGSNPYYPNYGSKLTTRIGAKAAGSSALLIREDVQQALQGVQSLQSGQKKYQSVSSRELLYRIDSVSVRSSVDDPTIFFVDVVVRNASNKPVNINTVFSVPGTIALAGSNGQTLGLEPTGLTSSQSQRVLLDG